MESQLDKEGNSLKGWWGEKFGVGSEAIQEGCGGGWAGPHWLLRYPSASDCMARNSLSSGC